MKRYLFLDVLEDWEVQVEALASAEAFLLCHPWQKAEELEKAIGSKRENKRGPNLPFLKMNHSSDNSTHPFMRVSVT
jgi:hypothetical protein